MASACRLDTPGSAAIGPLRRGGRLPPGTHGPDQLILGPVATFLPGRARIGPQRHARPAEFVPGRRLARVVREGFGKNLADPSPKAGEGE